MQERVKRRNNRMLCSVEPKGYQGTFGIPVKYVGSLPEYTRKEHVIIILSEKLEKQMEYMATKLHFEYI